MEILRTPDAVRQAVATYADYPGGIVLHGTPHIMRVGEVLEPRTSKAPAINQKGEFMEWEQSPPFIFAAPPGVPDVPIFSATVMADAPPFTTGVRAEGADITSGELFFMGSPAAIEAARERTGILCVLPANNFNESPRRSWIEVVSTVPTRIIGAYVVRHTALGFGIDSIPPLTIPGISAEKLRTLAATAFEALTPKH